MEEKQIGALKAPPTHFKTEYSTWASMLSRCYDETGKKNFLAYADCMVGIEWHIFYNFLYDCYTLPNARFKFPNLNERIQKFNDSEAPVMPIPLHPMTDKESLIYCNGIWALDKDVFGLDKKTYQKDSCCWLPMKLNSFFTFESEELKGVLQIKQSGNYMAKINRTVNGKHKTYSLGTFKSFSSAYHKYIEEKQDILNEYLSEFDFMDDSVKVACVDKLNHVHNKLIEKYGIEAKNIDLNLNQTKHSKKLMDTSKIKQDFRRESIIQLAEKSWADFCSKYEDDIYDFMKEKFFKEYLKTFGL